MTMKSPMAMLIRDVCFRLLNLQRRNLRRPNLPIGTSILNSTQRYTGCALFSLALNQSQTRQFNLLTSLPSLDPGPNDEEFIVAQSSNVSDHPHLWIHEHSGLIFPIFKFMGVNNHAWKGIIETSDSRHRVALRLLATWLDVEWIKMKALESTVACNLMDTEKSKQSKKEDTIKTNWKHGAIIGGAALAGGTLLVALTGGLEAPAIPQGIGALAPSLHAPIPAIGVTGVAEAVSGVGSFGGSIAVAASFGDAGARLTGSKVAKRLGCIEEFEFKATGDNHNQGRLAVGILVPGIVFKEENFVSSWHGYMENLERYTLHRIYGFYNECKRRLNVMLWKVFTDTFNCLHVAALIDDQILCMHGGLSPDLHNLDQIRVMTRSFSAPNYCIEFDNQDSRKEE